MSSWDTLLKHIEDALQTGVDNVSEEVRKEAATSSLYKGTGALRKSIRVIVTGKLSREILADSPHAYYVEFGNDAHGAYIEPKNSKSLRYISNGSVHFAKRVRTYAGRHFMREASEVVSKSAGKLIETELRKVI